MSHRVCLLLSTLVVLFAPLRAFAEATVLVELKGPGGAATEGTVQLAKGETKHRCSTDQGGRCEIRGVPGGIYTVSVEQPGKAPPKDKSVVIPPSGEVKLIVNAN